MKTLLKFVILCGISVWAVPRVPAEELIVKDGEARAEIIVAKQPPRTTRLAAHELHRYIEKISGAKLPVVTEPSETAAVKIYVGRSPHTDRLKITSEGLKYGAYRIVSGDDWLVLIGDDTDFAPIEPWPRSNSDWVSGRVHREWDKITGTTWGNPMSQLRKHYTGRAWDFGKPRAEWADKSDTIHVWGFDERGSFNAVCGFLRSLGVRWYMPGELGEVVPSMDSIPLPDVDETVQPDFPIRRFNVRFGVHGRDTAMWAMRLGVRDPYGLHIAHGLHNMTHRDEIRAAHPDWFALYGGKRHNQPGQRTNQLCYSNEELFQGTLRYVRALMDHYQFDVVSVMPPDGYVSICQCPLCEGKDTPERDYRGRLSDYVWDFVNRVAREVKKTHPDKMISNCAYGVYTLPPLKIEKLEPNVLVCIVGGRRPTNSRPEQQEEIRKLREGWVAKTDNPIMVFENYPFTGRGWYLPSYVPHVIGNSINATKGISQGEDIWLSVQQDSQEVAIGFNHFLVYFTARMYWGGKDQDVDELFNEYCRLFYGPAEREMKAFFEYCEANWQDMERDKSKVDRTFELLAAAQRKVTYDGLPRPSKPEEADVATALEGHRTESPPEAGGGSVYGKRIALIADYLKSLKNKGEQLARQRGPVPQLRLARDAEGIVIDGKLDDEFWQKAPYHAAGRLRELQTGRKPIFGTTFQAAWGKDGSIYFAIRCEERKGEPLNIGTTRREDQATWYGDVVEILLETESRSYYQLAVNPSGALVDLDRGAAKKAWFGWDSQAEVATHVAEDQWNVEIRIPVVQDENDPLHQVVGRKPISSLPWHFNVCRQRMREHGAEYSAFSPTGKKAFHDVLKFGQLYEGRSHQFSHAKPDSDYLEARRAASALMTQGKRAEALAAFIAAAKGEVTDFQKSDCLEQAAICARALKQIDLAAELAGQIPLEPVAKAVSMQNLLALREPETLIEQYGEEDISAWPFWKAGEAFLARGRAYAGTGAGSKAEADLIRALEFTTDSRTRLSAWLALGANREDNLKDDDAAFEAYRQIAQASKNNGSASYFRGVQGAARILRKRGQYDKALGTLRLVDIKKLHGYWFGSMHVALGKTLSAAGRKDEALAAYREVLTDENVSAGDRSAAEEAIRAIGP
jgi:tetratricopeptide (TPR) repeat protein